MAWSALNGMEELFVCINGLENTTITKYGIRLWASWLLRKTNEHFVRHKLGSLTVEHLAFTLITGVCMITAFISTNDHETLTWYWRLQDNGEVQNVHVQFQVPIPVCQCFPKLQVLVSINSSIRGKTHNSSLELSEFSDYPVSFIFRHNVLAQRRKIPSIT